MKRIALSIALCLVTIPTRPLTAQARDIPSAAPNQAKGETQEQRGRKLLDQMLEALGGEAWLNRRNLRVVRPRRPLLPAAPPPASSSTSPPSTSSPTATVPTPSASASSPTRA